MGALTRKCEYLVTEKALVPGQAEGNKWTEQMNCVGAVMIRDAVKADVVKRTDPVVTRTGAKMADKKVMIGSALATNEAGRIGRVRKDIVTER